MARKTSTTKSVYDAIRDMAIDYEFLPDENINESALAAQLGVSRTPVRDALNRLLNEGLMIFQPNRGFFCRSLSADELFYLAEARLGLERQALDLAFERGAAADREDLLEFWTDVDRRMPELTPREVARLDEEFHERIFHMSANPVLITMIEQLNARIRFVRQIEIDKPTRKGADFAEHFRIAKALIDSDRAGGREALARHLTFTREDSFNVLKEGLARIFMRERPLSIARR